MALFALFAALMENRVETVEIARVALEGRVKLLEDKDQTFHLRGKGRDSQSEGYIPAKMLMPKTFSDKPEDWRAWREDVLDWIDSSNPGVKDVLEEIGKMEEWDEFDITLILQGKADRVKEDTTQLWRALERVTEGESRKVVTSTKGEHSFQAWFALNRRFEPSVAARHGVVMADFTGMVGRPAKTLGELQTLMTEIMRKIKIIEDITGQEVFDMMAKAVLLGVLDPLTRQHTAAMHSQSFTKLRVKVLEFASNAVPNGGRDTMDVGRCSGPFEAPGQHSPVYDPVWEEEGYGGFNAIGKGEKGREGQRHR
mgnify:CR=1 FL=1